MQIQDIESLYAVIAEAVSNANELAGFAPGDQIFHLSNGYVISNCGVPELEGEYSFREVFDPVGVRYKLTTNPTEVSGPKMEYSETDDAWEIYLNDDDLAFSCATEENNAENVDIDDWVVGPAGALPKPTITRVVRVYPSTLEQLTETIFTNPIFNNELQTEQLTTSSVVQMSGAIRVPQPDKAPLIRTDQAVTNDHLTTGWGAFYVAGSPKHLFFRSAGSDGVREIDLGALGSVIP